MGLYSDLSKVLKHYLKLEMVLSYFEILKAFLLIFYLELLKYIRDFKMLKTFLPIFSLGVPEYLKDLKVVKAFLKLCLSLLENFDIFSNFT